LAATLADALDDPPAYAYGVAALTSWTFDADKHRAGALAQAGIDKAASPHDPELAECCLALAMVTLNSPPDRRRDAAELLERAFALYGATANPVLAAIPASVLVDVADGPSAQEWARAAHRLASRVRSQLADIWAALAEGAAASKRGDAASAVATLRVAYDQIVAADLRGTVKSVVLWRLGVALAEGPVTASDDAFLASSLPRLQSDGHKWGIGLGLWALAIYLAATSRLEPAAVVVGFLEHAGVQPLDAAGQRAKDAIATQPQHAEWCARGHQLSQDEVFAVALAALKDNDQ
jgi:hypothetical protein